MRSRGYGIGCSTLIASLVICGCSGYERYELTDTEGRRLNVSCGKDCEGGVVGNWNPRSGPSHPTVARPHASDVPGWALQAGSARYQAVCDSWLDTNFKTAAVGGVETCRIVRCESERSCPPVAGRRFGCTHGLCADLAVPLQTNDVVMLCQASTGAWTGSREQMRRKALAEAACTGGAASAVPAECRQP